MRKNAKKQATTSVSTISKSNELSLSQLNDGLTLRQMQLLAFAIYCTQQKAVTTFAKHELEKFYAQQYLTAEIKDDVTALMRLDATTIDYGERGIHMFHVFNSIFYLDGKFEFKWSEEMLPHILELKERFILIDLTITSKFASSYAWRLYEFLKAKHGQWSWEISKEDLMHLFNVQDKKSYRNTTNFKKKVLDAAIADVNRHTEFEVRYSDVKQGRKVVGFHIQWSKGAVYATLSDRQRNELAKYIQVILHDIAVVLSNNPHQQDILPCLEEVARYKQQILDQQAAVPMSEYKTHLKALQTLLKRVQNFHT